MHETSSDRWGDGHPYDSYMGRWSRGVAAEFLDWLAMPEGQAWVDVGCGTGALVERILAQCAPSAVTGVDRSAGFVDAARIAHTDNRVRFEVGNATNLPLESASVHAAVSGLALNFVDDRQAMIREMARVVQPKGRIGHYVWDYADGMEVLRHFWDAAAEADPQAAELDEGVRFPICRPDALRGLFESAGLHDVSLRSIDIQAVFPSFSDYWTPFLGGIGPAPTYLASATEPIRTQIHETLRELLSPDGDHAFTLLARAWAVQGTVRRRQVTSAPSSRTAPGTRRSLLLPAYLPE